VVPIFPGQAIKTKKVCYNRNNALCDGEKRHYLIFVTIQIRKLFLNAATLAPALVNFFAGRLTLYYISSGSTIRNKTCPGRRGN
jgi:hypothetical protein